MTTVKTTVTVVTEVDGVVVSTTTTTPPTPPDPITPKLTVAQERAVQLKLRAAYKRLIDEREYGDTGEAFTKSKVYRLHDNVSLWNEAVNVNKRSGDEFRLAALGVLNEDAGDPDMLTTNEVDDDRMSAFVNLFIKHHVVALRPYSEENGESETPPRREGTQGW